MARGHVWLGEDIHGLWETGGMRDWTHPPLYGWQASGTHSTGMPTCLNNHFK